MTKSEHREFVVAKRIIEAVHRSVGIPRQYLSRDWIRDQKLIRESSRRKQALRQEEQALVVMFESWRHGQPVPAVEAEPPQEERRAS
jgi:Ni/Co efflux regulator RcnB